MHQKPSSRILLCLVFASTALAACADGGAGATTSCEAVCNTGFECRGAPPTCLSQCNEIAATAEVISEECAAAFDADNNCAAALTCEQFMSWVLGEPPQSYPCLAEDNALDDACQGDISRLPESG